MWHSFSIHNSARKHYDRDKLSDEYILRAYMNAALSFPLDDTENPSCWLVLGNDPAGRLLEIVIFLFDEERALISHAMKARPQYQRTFSRYLS